MENKIKPIKYIDELRLLQKEADKEKRIVIGQSPNGRLYVLNKQTNKATEISQKEASIILREKTKFKEVKENISKQKNNQNQDYIYYSGLCLIIRDENEYLKEWIDNHLALGIEHIYIYDNGADFAPVSEIINQLTKEEKKKITIINWVGKYRHIQQDAYEDCLKQYGKECKWMGFIDTDELIRIIEPNKKINELLKDYESFGALNISWVMYNASSQIRKRKGTMKERFKETVDEWNEKGLGKVFVQTAKVKKMYTHSVVLREGEKTCNENYETDDRDFRNHFSGKKIVIDHYYTKSYEEWCKKIKRGVADPIYRRKYKEFFDYNPDLKHLYNEEMVQIQKYN